MFSAYGTFDGWFFILGAQIYDNSFPPFSPILYPEIHISAFLSIVVAGPLILAPQGHSFPAVISASLPGFTARLQAIVLSPLAGNGIFAASHAHDIVLQ